ncbi:IS5 family transposase [Aestuariicella hydrocarbonica]|uniref:IS5 family transposase n=1 Tax=Pseudomaricurvus hydrocarbonicus TaxID=1470433 RepID=A0A9E5MQD1_9GAMM|nr:IS5 family transposase [Aestuariicella hydrocarbonica]
MRGVDVFQESLFTTVQLESFVPENHPLRPIKALLNEAMKNLNWLFSSIYCNTGRESIPPERLIRAQLLQVLYSIRSERQLVEQINYNLLYRWFVGLTIDDPVWDHSTFSINRDRLLENDVITELFEEVVNLARKQKLLSDEHFSVDGTLIQAWASQKSYRRKDDDSEPPVGGGRNREANFHGEKRSNATHESKTDGDAMMAKKGPGKEAKLSYMGHTVMENRNGLIVKAAASQATGKAEREVAADLLAELPGMKKRTVGADKNYDTAGFVRDCRAMNITPHVARNDNRIGGSAIDGRTSRHAGYVISQQTRKRVEEPFGWGKTVGLIRQMKVRGLSKVNSVFMLTMIGWNLTRMRALQG